jgi:hypothetical protein
MPDDQARRLIEFLLAPDAEALDCDSVREALGHYADLKVRGQPMDVWMPGVAAHLEECSACNDRFEAIAELAHFEATEGLPEVDTLWAGLADVTGRAFRAEAGAAIASQASPRRPVPLPARKDVRSLSGSGGAGRSRPLGDWRRPELWSLALVGCTALALAFAWWRTDAEARERQHTLEAVGRISEVRFLKAEDGAWARIYFRPDDDGAVMYVGGLPPLQAGQRLECWLKRAGHPELATAVDQLRPGTDWWVIDAEAPLQDYQTVSLMVNTDGQRRALLEVPLAETR